MFQPVLPVIYEHVSFFVSHRDVISYLYSSGLLFPGNTFSLVCNISSLSYDFSGSFNCIPTIVSESDSITYTPELLNRLRSLSL